jgi:hypothetical protein
MIKPPLPAAGPAAKFASTLVSHMPTALGDVDNLPQALTIGGTDYAPNCYLVADDINPSTGTWASRHNATKIMSVTGSGTLPTYGNDTAIANDAVKYGSARFHLAADSTWAQIGAGDWAFEVIFIPRTTTTGMIFSSYDGTDGLLVYWNGTAVIVDILYSSVEYARVTFSVPTDHLAHIFCGGDKSDSYYTFGNGAYVNSRSIAAATDGGTSQPMAVGAHPSGAGPGDHSVLHVAIWDLPTNPWPGSGTNQAVMGAIAASRFATVAGIGCQKNTTYSFARASVGYVDRYVSATQRQLFAVSSGWPRVCERKDSAGSTVTGYLSEVQATNDFTYSEDATQWSAVRTTIASNAVTAPDGTTTADGIVSDAGLNTHYVSISTASVVGPHVFSCWLKAGAQSWSRMDIHTSPNAYAYFDLANGVMGTIGADVTSYGIEPWGNGWYRCWIEYTGGVAAHDHHIHTADANDGQSWNPAGGTTDLYVWGAQHEDEGSVIPTSYIKTAAATATRIKDSLTRTIPTLSTGKVTAQCSVLLGTGHNSTLTKTIMAIDDLG